MARELRKAKGEQVFSKQTRAHLREIAEFYFERLRPTLIDSGIGVAELDAPECDAVFREMVRISHLRPARSTCLRLLATAKKSLISIDGRILGATAGSRTGGPSKTDSLIIESLREVSKPAALAYEQALHDLDGPKRLSYRGPAADLREALRETLDVLAVDADVVAQPGFKLEGEAKRPTMKQKVRHILRKRGLKSGQLAVPENALEGVEKFVGDLFRSIYDRSSVSTHTETSKEEVQRVQNWTRLILCELLEIPM